MSKPVCLREGEDSSKSSESSESNSSEETASHVEPSQDPLQPALTETGVPNAIEETDPPDTAALPPSAESATLNTSALPDPEDPQSSTDALQLMPDDPSQTALGVDISQDMPDPAQDSINADTVHVVPDMEVSRHPGTTETDLTIGVGGTTQLQVTTTYQGFPQGATPPFPPTHPPVSTTPPLPIPISTALTGVPVCFTFTFETPEPDPPRGDSI
ncbi:low-density lipoprotein receptor-related protein 2 [Lates japonicus]|uniref:Low-density lipoprotein receptor-related protein 2 n=1 Tax=Lates japonicus TaxID=270547 RepID=A0AAD3MFK1_LATJO|nr:low-density lipoprotein receptor-related protein 2 [Lates japonicus]